MSDRKQKRREEKEAKRKEKRKESKRKDRERNPAPENPFINPVRPNSSLASVMDLMRVAGELLSGAYKETTPDEITPAILELMATVKAETPVFVPVKPAPHAKNRSCYPNVEQQIEQHGGEMVQGWLIWQCQKWIKAIHHAVWKSPEGELIDISSNGDETSLFAPALQRFQGKRIPAIFLPLVSDPSTLEMLEIVRLQDSMGA